jgi:hypothetical protein
LLIATPFVGVLADILLTLVLSYSDGYWEFFFNVDDVDITMMIIGFIVRFIAVVMDRANQLKEENELTI